MKTENRALKICAYEVREDEHRDFQRIGEELGLDIIIHDKVLTIDNAEWVNDCDGVTIDELYARSDIIIWYMPLTAGTFYMINEETLAKMKDGVVIINCARGELAEVDALIQGIESGRIGALGLDAVEEEEGITDVDHRIDILFNRHMAYLC